MRKYGFGKCGMTSPPWKKIKEGRLALRPEARFWKNFSDRILGHEPRLVVTHYARGELNEPPVTLEIRKFRGKSLHNPVQSIKPTPDEVDLLTLTLEVHKQGDIE